MKRLVALLFALGVSMTWAGAQPAIKSRGSKKDPFTFVQVSDPQLGFCAKGQDWQWTVGNLKTTVAQINALKPAFVIVTVIVINVAAFAIAYMLTKKINGSNIFRSVFFMPNLIGGIILGWVWQLLLNSILAIWGKTIVYSPTYGFIGMVLLLCWQQIGYMMVIYIAGLQNIPGDYIEAAKVDGANSRQMLWRIILPSMMPSITICSFLTITNGFKMFDQNLALTNGAPSKMSELLALNIFNTFYGRNGFEGVGQAKAVIFFIAVAVIAVIQNRLTTRKEVQA